MPAVGGQGGQPGTASGAPQGLSLQQ